MVRVHRVGNVDDAVAPGAGTTPSSLPRPPSSSSAVGGSGVVAPLVTATLDGLTATACSLWGFMRERIEVEYVLYALLTLLVVRVIHRRVRRTAPAPPAIDDASPSDSDGRESLESFDSDSDGDSDGADRSRFRDLKVRTGPTSAPW